MSLRDIFITLVVLGTLPFVLRHAYIGVLLWTWLSVMNPHKLAWGFAMNMQFAAMAAGATLIGLFTTRDRVKLPINAVIVTLFMFAVWMCVTTVFAIDRVSSLTQLEQVLKILLMTFVASAVLHERKHIQAFIWIVVLSLGFYGAKGGLFTILGGGAYRVYGPPGGFIEGNNEIGLALVIVIPLMYFLYSISASRLVKLGLLGMIVLSIAAILGTHSRGGFLAVGAMLTFMWWRAPNKILVGLPILLAAVALLMFMPEHWAQRMWTIQTYSEDGSAMGRIHAWGTMVNLANARLTGGGFASYSQYVFAQFAPGPGVNRAAHSIYFQVLGEHGWIGLMLFLATWGFLWRRASRLRRIAKKDPEDAWIATLASMCQVSLVGYAVGGAFLSLAYFDVPYNVLIMVLAAERLQAARRSAPPAALENGGRANHGARGGPSQIAPRGGALVGESRSP